MKRRRLLANPVVFVALTILAFVWAGEAAADDEIFQKRYDVGGDIISGQEFTVVETQDYGTLMALIDTHGGNDLRLVVLRTESCGELWIPMEYQIAAGQEMRFSPDPVIIRETADGAVIAGSLVSNTTHCGYVFLMGIETFGAVSFFHVYGILDGT
jgi:hypothetical protein